MAINYNITNGELHLNLDIDGNTPQSDIERDVAIALGAILASGHGQVFFGTINRMHISGTQWGSTDCPKLVEKYGYSTSPDASYAVYRAVMSTVDKVAKYPDSNARPAEPQPADDDIVVTGETLARFNQVCAEAADKLSEFYNSGKSSVPAHEIEELGLKVGELFKSFAVANGASNVPAVGTNPNIADMLKIDIAELGVLADPDHEKSFLEKLAAATQPATKNAAAYAGMVKDIATRCNVQRVTDEEALKFVLYHWNEILAF